MQVELKANLFARNLLDRGDLATITKEMFGGIDVNLSKGAKAAFAASVDYLNLSLIRWPGGQITEGGKIDSDRAPALKLTVGGADQDLWMKSANDPLSSDYLYDLSYSELMHPLALQAVDGRSNLTDTVKLALSHKAALELFIPFERYSDMNSVYSPQERRDLQQRLDKDVDAFLDRLFVVKQFGALPEKLILDLGNENLVWTTRFEGEALGAQQNYDPAAVAAGIGQYIELLAVSLSRVAVFRAEHADADFEIAIQLPYMNNKIGSTSDPQDVFLQLLKTLPNNLLAQVDVLRFHPLDMSFTTAATYENWFADELREVKAVIEAAQIQTGKIADVSIAASAWSTDGGDTPGDIFDPIYSLKAAAASIAAVASFAELGVDYAATWGVAIPYRQDVQISRFDPSLGRMVYTPRGEVLRQMAETLPGTTLLNIGPMADAGRTGPVNLQAFADDSKVVIFVSANDIADGGIGDGGSQGEVVTLDISGLGGEIGYVWIETIVSGSGIHGDAFVWNPLTDVSGTNEAGESWVSYDGTALTFRLNQDYQIARVIVSRTQPGTSTVELIGDSRRGHGIVDDLLTGGSAADTLMGQTGNDTLLGGSGSDYLEGGPGDDIIEINGRFDTIIGGFGADTVTIVSGFGAVFNLETGINNQNATIESIENIVGTVYGDQLTGTNGFNFIDGAGGRDSLFGLDGNDTLMGGGSADVLYGGFGIDFASYYGSKAAVQVDLRMPSDNTGDAFGDRFVSIEGVIGSDFSDTIRGSLNSDRLQGGAGNDLLFGHGGSDELYGGVGDDTLIGGFAGDSLFGGQGFDIASYLASKTGVVVNLDNPPANSGHARNDNFHSIEGLAGSAYGDSLTGNGDSNIISGGGGIDRIYGLAGVDTLFGGDGDDFLFGGQGSDYLTGGVGKDCFFNQDFSEYDIVVDYNPRARDYLSFDGRGADSTDFFITVLDDIKVGNSNIAEIGVFYRPTGDLAWLIQDGAELKDLYISIGSTLFDLI